MQEDFLKGIWPEWKVVRVLGKGSYGTVFEAERRDSQILSKAAIKWIHVPRDDSEVDSLRSEGMTEENAKEYYKTVVDSFINEIKIMETLKGVQNIVSVEDFAVIENKNGIGWDIFIRMELLTPFNSFIADHYMSENEIINLGIDMCTALEFCAKRNIIHRDIKPENIFVNSFGDFKLGDFGIARKLENVTGGLSLKGTFFYMAPEVEKRGVYDSTADIYSLGLVLYRLANYNRLPFIENDQQAMNPNARQDAVRRRLSGEQFKYPAGVSSDLGQIIMCATSYEPSQRFVNATVMKTALRSLYKEPVYAGAAHGQAPAYNSTSVNNSTPVNNFTPAYVPEPVYNDQSYDQYPDENNNKKIIGPIIAVISGALAVVAAIILLFIAPGFLVNRDNSKNDSEINADTEITRAVQNETEQTEPTAPSETTPAETTASKETETTTSGNLGIATAQTAETNTEPVTTQPETTTPAPTTVAPTTVAPTTPASSSAYAPYYNTVDTSQLKVGDIISLGYYEQDNNLSNGSEPIEWVKIYEEEGNHLLISRYALDARPFDYSGTCSSWDNCSLRSWLNNDFYNSAFGSSEKSRIQQSRKTQDYVSLLVYDSTGENGVTYFFKSQNERTCYATAYAVANGAWVTADNGHSPWWLRAMDGSSNAFMVKSTGEIGSNVVTNGASSEDIAGHTLVTVRPIIWIN